MSRHSTPSELPLHIDKSATASIPSQLAEQIRTFILNSTLAPGDVLPSTRALAERLGISRGSVVAAYEQLTGEGYISAGRGGTQVNENLPPLPSNQQPLAPSSTAPSPRHDVAPPSPGRVQPMPLPVRQMINMQPGTPDTTHLTSAAWRAAWRIAAAEPGITYPAMGSPELQKELAEHLRLMRSVVRDPESILVTTGARDGLRLVLSALRREIRHRPLRIAVENPGYPSLHKIPAAINHSVLPVAVDEHGLNPANLPTGVDSPDLVLVAPSHQYPLGASMPIARRLELLAWAAENNAYIVEDDYDSELRYTGNPLPALASLARSTGEHHDRVITLGSFTKTLTPGLGLGYLIAPKYLTHVLEQLRAELGSPVSAIVQKAMTEFLRDGGARRHIARMRRVYKARRATLLEAFEQGQLPEWVRVLPMDGGLHVVLEFGGAHATEATERTVVEIVEESGVLVSALGDYWAHSGMQQQHRAYGVVIGFGGAKDQWLEQGIRLLVLALKRME